MKIGVGFPLYFRGVDRQLLLDWLTVADAGPFDVITGGERLVYPSNDLMVTLGITAAATERLEIITVPLYLSMAAAGVVAKQFATLDTLTSGRAVLGVGMGVHPDDFQVADASYDDRVERFADQLALIRRIWRQEPAMDGVGVVGPAPTRPDGPEILIASWEPESLAALPLFGDGIITFGFDGQPADHVAAYESVLPSWKEKGRDGQPRVVAGNFFALGPAAERGAAAYLGEHYAWLSADEQRAFIDAMACKSAASIKETIARFEDAGVIDTLFFTPTIASMDQLELLADAVS